MAEVKKIYIALQSQNLKVRYGAHRRKMECNIQIHLKGTSCGALS
jgi:hypothetical protein